MVHPDTAVMDAITEIFEKRLADGISPGSSVAMFDTNGVFFERGFGEYRQGSGLPDAGTAFRIASCTKSFTAATLLLLRDRGLLELDTPVTEFVPAFRASIPGSGESSTPTVRMLMTMSGGLATDDPWGDRQESLTPAEFDAVLSSGTPLVSVPGTSFEYSNLGYALLGRVVECVAGSPYIDVVGSELLEPLGLTATGFDERTTAASLATGYRRSGDEWLPLPFSSPGAFSPIGGVFTNARDLSRWAAWLAGALDTYGTDSGPLSSASRREMQHINQTIPIEPAADPAARAAPSEYGYGFGLFVEKDARRGHTVFHSGGYPGFGAHMRWNAPTGLGIVAFENATYSGVARAAATALDLAVADAGRPPSPTPWPELAIARSKCNSLLSAWNDAVADDAFAMNVALDVPYPERRAAIADAIERVGGLDEANIADQIMPDDASPARSVWMRQGRAGRLRCEILLSPTAPPRVQKFTVTAEVAD